MIFSGQIHLANNGNCFFSGDTVMGRVEIQNDEDAIIKDVYIILEGVTYVRWEDLDQKSINGEIVYFMQVFESKDICVRRQITLQHNGVLHKGRHEYQFGMKLPENIPSTLTTTSGFVNYEMILVLDEAENCHKLQQQTIQIQRRLNITEKPQLMLPFTDQYTQHFCWWPCKSKPITTLVTLSSRAFIPGDYVNYSLFIENYTKYYDVKRVSAFIIQTRKFKSRKPKQRIKTELCTLNYRTHQNPCVRNSKQCLEDTFQLPSNLVVSSQENSAIMVSYRFQVLVIMKGFHQDGSLVIPLTIGSHRQGLYVAAAGDFINNSESTKMINGLSIDMPPPPLAHMGQPSCVSIVDV